MRAVPAGEAIGVAAEVERCNPDGAGRMGDRGATRKWRPLFPLDEERKGGLGTGLLDAGQPPPHELAASAGARAGAYREAEPAGDVVELVGTDRPTERPRERAMCSSDQLPNGLCAASASSTTATSSR